MLLLDQCEIVPIDNKVMYWEHCLECSDGVNTRSMKSMLEAVKQRPANGSLMNEEHSGTGIGGHCFADISVAQWVGNTLGIVS